MSYPAATVTGRHRYPPDGVVHCEAEDLYCVCLSDCRKDCMGECGCPACRQAMMNYLASGTASPAEREEFQRRDRLRRVPILRDLEDEIDWADIEQANLKRIQFGWSQVDKSAMSAKTQLLAWMSSADITGIEPETAEPSLLAEGYIDKAGNLTDAGREMVFGG